MAGALLSPLLIVRKACPSSCNVKSLLDCPIHTIKNKILCSLAPRNVRATFVSPKQCQRYFLQFMQFRICLMLSYDFFILTAYWTVTDGKPMPLWIRTAWTLKFDESLKSPVLRFIINIQTYHQTMNVIPINKVTFHPLSLHHGCNKRHWLPFMTEPLSKICCTSIAAWLWGQAVVLVWQPK
jgi:hypothetical protein